MIILSLIVGLLPGLTWLLFYLKEDGKPEPFFTVLRVFFGGAVAAFVGLGFQLFIRGQIAGDNIGVATSNYPFLFAAIEECVKFIAAFLAIRYSAALDEPVDAIFYPIVAALGFATVENVAVAHTLIAGGSIAAAFEVITLRFVGATLVHSVASGTVGYFWARSLMRHKNSLLAIPGLVIATALHGTFNVLILSYGNTLYTFAFLIGAALLVLFDFHEIRVDEQASGFTSHLSRV